MIITIMYKTLADVSIDSLKRHCTLIHYFGLGFIQIKLGDIYRMHVYTPELPAITSEEDVHNHRYDFTSAVLAGTFEQDIFAVHDGDTHLREEETCKEGVPATSASKPCALQKVMEQCYGAGGRYHIAHDVFHRVRTRRAVTLLERGPVVKELAEVVRPVGADKVCPFSRKISAEKLWSIVEDLLRTHGIGNR